MNLPTFTLHDVLAGAVKSLTLYIIRPQDALLQTIVRSGVDGADLLSAPELWSRSEVMASYMRGPITEELSHVKLLYLARLVWDYVDNAKASAFKDFVCSLLNLPLGLIPATFDRWWTVERLEGPDFTCEDMEKELAGVLAKHKRTD